MGQRRLELEQGLKEPPEAYTCPRVYPHVCKCTVKDGGTWEGAAGSSEGTGCRREAQMWEHRDAGGHYWTLRTRTRAEDTL